MLQWAQWLEIDFDRRRVALDQTQYFEVSTVFLGLDHQWGNGPPILFETMVFEREREIIEAFGELWSVREDVGLRRYATWDDALTGHQTALRRLQKHEADALAALPKLRAKRRERSKP